MTEKANPSPNRPADAFKTAGAIAHGGGSVDGYIIDGSNPTNISVQDTDIDETALDAFSQSSSSSSLTVGINAGEAFVYGSWLAIDTQTTVSLNSSTTGQTVYVGWNKDTSNDVIIGLDSEFATAIADTDQRIPLYDFNTDGDGVTNVTNRRQIGQAQDLPLLSVADQLNIPIYADTTNAPSEEGSIIVLDGTGSETAGLYLHDGSQYIKVGKNEQGIEDIVVSLLVGGSGISVNYDDSNDSLSINNDEIYTDEDAQEAVGTILGQLFEYNNFDNSITVSISDGETLYFGTDDDTGFRYDPNSDAIIFSDSTNTTDRLALDRTTGDLRIAGEITENESL